MRQNIKLFNKDRGDLITPAEVDALAIEVYNKTHTLVPDNVGVITTGQFKKGANSYIGAYSMVNANFEYIDLLLSNESDRIEDVLVKLRG